MCCFFSCPPAPPLTLGNVLEVVKGVHDWKNLSDGLGIYSMRNIEEVMEQFLLGNGRYQPSWRAIIFTLDDVWDTCLADRIRSYAHGEPVQGVCVLCVCVCVCVCVCKV